jgi:hypothetical protein
MQHLYKLAARARSIIAGVAILAAVILASAPALASQASCIMPTTGTVSGLVLVNDINACNQSILSLFSGATAPPSPSAGMFWYNTSTGYIQEYDGTTWLNLWFVDATNHLITREIGGGITTATVLAASTTDLGAVKQSFVIVSGSSTINTFGSSAQIGSVKIIYFGDSPTLVNSSSLFLPGNTNIAAAGGDIAIAVHLSGSAWQVVSYMAGARSPQVGGFSLLGNATGTRGAPTDIFGPSLTQKASPAGTDKLLIWDSGASNALKYINVSSIFGVTSIAGLTGAFSLSTCLTNSGNAILFNCFVFNAAATKSDQQSASSNVVGVTPLHQQDHDSAIKAWLSATNTGSTLASYNASVTAHPSNGVYTVTFATGFSSANYSCVGTAVGNNTVYFGTKTSTTIVVNTVQLGSSPTGADVAFDIHCTGRQ